MTENSSALNNELTGTIPQSVSRASKLTSLYVSLFHSFSFYLIFFFVFSFYTYISFTFSFVTNNSLTGSIPSALTLLPKIELLYLFIYLFFILLSFSLSFERLLGWNYFNGSLPEFSTSFMAVYLFFILLFFIIIYFLILHFYLVKILFDTK